MKIVINTCYGGFGLSDAATERYAELNGVKIYKEDLVYIAHFYTVPVEEYKKIYAECTLARDYNKINKIYYTLRNVERTDNYLIQVIEELGKAANGNCSELKIVEIPDGVQWDINEYDGYESIHEKHRVWE